MAQAGARFDFLGDRFWRGQMGKLRRFIRPKSRQKLRARKSGSPACKPPEPKHGQSPKSRFDNARRAS